MTTVRALDCAACSSLIGPEDLFCEACGHDTPQAEVRLGQATAARDHLETDLLTVAAASDRGRRHARNEDAFAISVAPDGRILAIVCDGVSTTASPDQASQAAADAALVALLDGRDDGDGDDLEAAYRAARRAVHQIPWVAEGERTGAPSCTFLSAAVRDNQIRLASMGDCRAFWLPDAGEPQTLTVDDSWAAEEVLAGRMTADAVRGDPRGHSITRWLGQDADPSWMPRRVSLEPETPGRLVLCSDGLWNYADCAGDVASIAIHATPALVARSLVEWANDQGGQDNVTVVVVDLGVPDDGAREKGPAR